MPTPRPAPRALALATFSAASLLFAARADADVEAIPPGQETLIADLLGKGAALPGGCAWSGASIDRFAIDSRYTCAGQEVVIHVEPRSAAPNAVAGSKRFAFTVKRGDPPAGLVDAVAARVGAREGELRSSRVQPTPPAQTQPQANPMRTSLRGAAVVAGVTIAAGIIAAVAIVRASRRFIAPGHDGARRAWTAQALATVAALAFVALAHRGLAGLAAAADAILTRRPPVDLALGAVTAIACVIAATLAAAVLTRRPALLSPRATLAAVAALYLGAGYAQSFPAEPHRFGSLITPVPRSETVDPFPDRARITYRTNEHGFREPSFAIEKPPGARRIVLIGDSYVFGIGVDRGDTLAVRLDETLRRKHPDRGFEVLNLGIPGDNLGSHVDLYAEAVTRLAPDDVILCLTLPNDLSRWDTQVQQRDAARLSALSVTRFLLGRPALTFFDYALLDQHVTRAGIAHLESQLARLDGIRKTSPSPPRTYLFAFARPDPQLDPALAANPDIPLLPIGDTTPADFIPNDGHPTAAGNRRFAAWIADTLAPPSTTAPPASTSR